jgi:tRNA (mo5U34)-methyltransferase
LKADLREEIIRLGPWHHEVQVTPEISTRLWLDAPPGTYPDSWGKPRFRDPRPGFEPVIKKLYPDGLEGRSVLDCACNCGGYIFMLKELGAGECFGFDVREHWIKQANFLLEHRTGPTDGIRFEVCDLYDLPEKDLPPFDITIFSGLFYHLPDPITGLKIAADMTRELIAVRTAIRSDLPDGMMTLAEENPEKVMAGVYGLNWMPTGPDVLARILKWAGFAETRLIWGGKGWGRMLMLGSRKAGFLKDLGEPIPPPPFG